jgi:hypothetical protein
MVAFGLKTPENALGYKGTTKARLRREDCSDARVDLVYPPFNANPAS